MNFTPTPCPVFVDAQPPRVMSVGHDPFCVDCRRGSDDMISNPQYHAYAPLTWRMSSASGFPLPLSIFAHSPGYGLTTIGAVDVPVR